MTPVNGCKPEPPVPFPIDCGWQEPRWNVVKRRWVCTYRPRRRPAPFIIQLTCGSRGGRRDIRIFAGYSDRVSYRMDAEALIEAFDWYIL